MGKRHQTNTEAAAQFMEYVNRRVPAVIYPAPANLAEDGNNIVVAPKESPTWWLGGFNSIESAKKFCEQNGLTFTEHDACPVAAYDFTWSGTADLSVATLSNGVKVAVRFGTDEIAVQTVFQRLENRELGDDLPIVMEAFGVDYEAACDAVFNARFDEAITLLRSAVGTSLEKAELPGMWSHRQRTADQQAAFDSRHGIKPGDREAANAAIARIEAQAAATKRQIDAFGPRNAREYDSGPSGP